MIFLHVPLVSIETRNLLSQRPNRGDIVRVTVESDRHEIIDRYGVPYLNGATDYGLYTESGRWNKRGFPVSNQ
jgi:hypothetical protein